MTSKAAQKSRMISGYFDDGNKKPEKDGQERRGCTYFFAKTELSVPVTREGEKNKGVKQTAFEGRCKVTGCWN